MAAPGCNKAINSSRESLQINWYDGMATSVVKTSRSNHISVTAIKSGLVESATTLSTLVFGRMLLQLEQYMDIPCPCWKATCRISDGVIDTRWQKKCWSAIQKLRQHVTIWEAPRLIRQPAVWYYIHP